MKLFLCILIIVIGVNALKQKQAEKLIKVSKECSKSTKIAPALLAKFLKGEIVNDPKVHSELLCIAKKVGLATPSGAAIVPKLKSRIKEVSKDDKEVKKIMKKCNVKKKTPEMTAYEVYTCLQKEKPQFSPVP